MEEELKVAYVTTAERIGIRKGREEGMREGVQLGEIALLLRQLQYKFKAIPETYHQKLNEANVDTLLKWGERVLDSQKLEEVFED